ncbi:MAG TPA: ferritin-like domain-containing protein [Thermoleophilaceae bacterium]
MGAGDERQEWPRGEARGRIIALLREALADELALARRLRSHIASAPRGPYRAGLERYLRETRSHVTRVGERLAELGEPPSKLRAARSRLVGWLLAPFAALRRRSETKMLASAQFGCATEGLVVATYLALEQLAERAGDTRTADLARGIRLEEQQMLEWLRHEILKLTDSFLMTELDLALGEPPVAVEGRRPPRRWHELGELPADTVRDALAQQERH